MKNARENGPEKRRQGARAGKSNPSPRAICTLFYFTFISREPTLFHICRLHLTFAPHASFQYTIFHSILSSFAFYQVAGPCSDVEFCQTKRRHWRVQHSTNLCIINDDLTQYKTDSRQRKSSYLKSFANILPHNIRVWAKLTKQQQKKKVTRHNLQCGSDKFES